jgi:PAS domain S-box-containing protein
MAASGRLVENPHRGPQDKAGLHPAVGGHRRPQAQLNHGRMTRPDGRTPARPSQRVARTRPITDRSIPPNPGAFHLETIGMPAKPTYEELERRIQALEQAERARAHSELQLRESEEKFRLTFDASPDAVNINRLEDGLFVDINEGFTRLTGYTREEVIGKTSVGINIWQDPADRERLVRELRAKGYCGNLEAQFRKKDGRVDTALMSARVMMIKGVAHIISITRDISGRKAMEKALRETKRLLEETQAITGVGGWEFDVATGRHHWTDEVYRIYGVERDFDPIDLRRAIGFYAPEHAAIIEEAFRKAVDQGTPYDLELEFIRRDGARIWVRTTARPLVEDGRVTRVTGNIMDITQRKQAGEVLRASEAKHRQMIANITDVIAIIDPQGVIRYKSPNIEKWFGWRPEDLVGTEVWEVIHPDDRERIQAEFTRLLSADRAAKTAELRYRCKDGAFKWIELTAVNLTRDPIVQGVLTSYHDITERRQAEQHYTQLFVSMPVGFALHEVVLDGTGRPRDYRFLKVNPAFENLTGLRAEDLIGRTVLEALPETEPLWIELYGRVALSGEATHFESYSQSLDKHFAVAAYCPAPGQFAVSFQDITDRKKAEAEKVQLQAQLIQAQKLESVGRLAGGVAHDFNNMLGVILGHAELAMEEVDADDPLHAELQQIHRAAMRSADLTRQLLAFARKQIVAPRVLDLNDTVAGMLKMLRRLIGEDIDLAWMPGAVLWPVKIDPAQIDQILANLCVNARDAIAGVGKVTIETQNVVFDEAFCARHPGFSPGEFMLLAVSDDGCGMSREVLDNLFEPFFTTKEVGAGTGLGLATVYGIVKQNGGFINVYSEPGQGSVFKIYLPRFTGEPMPPGATPGEEIPCGAGEAILLVEDEPTILNLARSMLERLGYRVLTADTPREALQLAASRRGAIDLLMTDVVMPEMNGRDLARRLLATHPGLKLLFMSGYTANVIAHHGVLDEGVEFIQKPFSKKDLAVKVRQVLAGPRRAHDNL